MNWASFSEFFAMGGYGLYVWGSFLVSATAFCAEWFLLRKRYKVALRQIKRGSPLLQEYSNESST